MLVWGGAGRAGGGEAGRMVSPSFCMLYIHNAFVINQPYKCCL